MGNRFGPVAAGTSAVLAFVLLVSVSSSSAQLIPVTSCGQVVTGDAELTADLDCAAETEGPMLTLTGKLYLNGHTLKGNPALGYALGTVVKCTGRCTVIGPGTIRDGDPGIYANTDLTLNDVTLEGNMRGARAGVRLRANGAHVLGTGILDDGNYGLSCAFVDVRDSVITNSGHGLVCFLTGLGKGTCSVRNSVVSDNVGIGIDAAQSLRAREVTVSGNGWQGIRTYYGKSTLRDSLVQGNGYPVNGPYWSSGVVTSGGRIQNSQLLDNASAGVFAAGSKFGISGSTITGNGDSGAIGMVDKFRIKEATVTGNCAAPTDELECADISTFFTPQISDTTCNTSNEPYSGTTHGVCALD